MVKEIIFSKWTNIVPKTAGGWRQATILFCLGLGLVLRVARYIVNRSLWMDEAWLALNIVNRSFWGLFQPLDYNQGAPIGFLLVEKMLVELLGSEDYILRIFSLISGCVALLVMGVYSKRWLSMPAAVVAVGLFAVSDRLVYFASEVKPYSSDVAINLLLCLLVAELWKSDLRPKTLLRLGLAGATALWFSYPALFVLTGIGCALIVTALIRKDRRWLCWGGVTLLFWFISFVILYLVSLRSLANQDALVNYWMSAFMPLPPWKDWAWFDSAFRYMFVDPVGLKRFYLSAGLSLIGWMYLVRRHWQGGLSIAVSFLALLLASGLRHYPFSDRMLLFLVPYVIWLVACGLEWLYLVLRRVRWVGISMWLILVMMLVYDPLMVAGDHFVHPPLGEHLKPVLAHVQAQRQEQDIVYVYYGAIPAFMFYADRYGFEVDQCIIGAGARKNPENYRQALESLTGYSRVWFIFSHVCNWDKAGDEEVFFLAQLDQLGKRLDEFKAAGAAVYLYDLQIQP